MDNDTQKLEQFNQKHIQNSIFTYPIFMSSRRMRLLYY